MARLPVLGTISWLWFAVGVVFAMFIWPWVSSRIL